MFDFLFGWRKASKCKKLIRHVQCRLKLLKYKKESIVSHLHEDIVKLLKNGQEQNALVRVEQLSKEENMIAAYDVLEYFCEFVILQLPYIRRHKDCPNDINEAMSSLLFASARCGDLRELHKLRKLFRKRYGNKFVTTAIELLPGNLVNHQIIEKLSMKSISHDVKFKLMKEIAKDNNLQLRSPELDGRFDLRCHNVYDPALGDRELGWEKQISEVEKHDELDPLDEPVTVSNRSYAKSNQANFISSGICRTTLQHKVERTNGVKSESLSKISLRSLFYLDDIEEIKPNLKENGKEVDDDQSVFIFKLTIPPQRNKYKQRKSGRKTMKRKCVAFEDEMYYGEYPQCFLTRDVEVDWGSKSSSQSSGVTELVEQQCRKCRQGECDDHFYCHSSSDEGLVNEIMTTNMSSTTTNITPFDQTPQSSSSRFQKQIQSNKSSSFSSCHHIHPKLPDYDDLVTKFMALKKKHLDSNQDHVGSLRYSC